MPLISLTNEEYHRKEHGISRSQLWKILQSPAHYQANLKEEFTESHDMLIGSCLHTAVLESNKFAQRYCVVDGDGRSATVKEAKAKAKAMGYAVINSEDQATVFGMTRAINRHPIALGLVSGGIVEQAMTWVDEYGLQLKAKPDLIREDHIFIDLKTTRDASVHRFQNGVLDYGYHFQAAWYQEGLTANGYDNYHPIIIAVENVEPYNVVVYNISDELLEFGKREVKRAKEIYLRCVENNYWPGYSDKIETLEVPRWKRRELGYE